MAAPTANDTYAAFMRRAVRALGRRAGRDIELLAELDALRAQLDECMALAVAELRSEEGGAYSWAEIGKALGVSRQAAEKRWGDRTPAGARKPGGQPSELR